MTRIMMYTQEVIAQNQRVILFHQDPLGVLKRRAFLIALPFFATVDIVRSSAEVTRSFVETHVRRVSTEKVLRIALGTLAAGALIWMCWNEMKKTPETKCHEMIKDSAVDATFYDRLSPVLGKWSFSLKGLYSSAIQDNCIWNHYIEKSPCNFYTPNFNQTACETRLQSCAAALSHVFSAWGTDDGSHVAKRMGELRSGCSVFN